MPPPSRLMHSERISKMSDRITELYTRVVVVTYWTDLCGSVLCEPTAKVFILLPEKSIKNYISKNIFGPDGRNDLKPGQYFEHNVRWATIITRSTTVELLVLSLNFFYALTFELLSGRFARSTSHTVRCLINPFRRLNDPSPNFVGGKKRTIMKAFSTPSAQSWARCTLRTRERLIRTKSH